MIDPFLTPQPPQLLAAGDIDVKILKLMSFNGTLVDLDDYLIEFNLIEDMYSPSLHGSVIISDSADLIDKMPIVGEELLIVKMTTPGMSSSIEKSFRVYAVTDREVIRDTNTQMYTLHFCSMEAIVDTLYPSYYPYQGIITDIVSQVFDENLLMSKTYNVTKNGASPSEEQNSLIIYNETENKAKFVSPGWSPFKIMNWLATKSKPKDLKASTYLFWESNKSFYYGSVEHIINEYNRTDYDAGNYKYSVSNFRNAPYQIGNSIEREIFIVETSKILDQVNKLENYRKGYLANNTFEFDINKKKIVITDYDLPPVWNDYKHMERSNPVPFFLQNTARNPLNHQIVYPATTKVFSAFSNNYPEKMRLYWSNRTSLMQELNNFKLNIIIPGRTDIEVGMIIKFTQPDASPKSDEDKTKDLLKYYSGFYLITTIRHKITPLEHMMVLEIVKDSLRKDTYDQ